MRVATCFALVVIAATVIPLSGGAQRQP